MDDTGGLLVFDGGCSICSALARWIVVQWPTRSSARAIAWQELGGDELNELGLSLPEVQRSVWWVERANRKEGPRAVARALIEARGFLALLGVLILLPPMSWVAPNVYRLVARFRHRLPGSTPACRA